MHLWQMAAAKEFGEELGEESLESKMAKFVARLLCERLPALMAIYANVSSPVTAERAQDELPTPDGKKAPQCLQDDDIIVEEPRVRVGQKHSEQGDPDELRAEVEVEAWAAVPDEEERRLLSRLASHASHDVLRKHFEAQCARSKSNQGKGIRDGAHGGHGQESGSCDGQRAGQRAESGDSVSGVELLLEQAERQGRLGLGLVSEDELSKIALLSVKPVCKVRSARFAGVPKQVHSGTAAVLLATAVLCGESSAAPTWTVVKKMLTKPRDTIQRLCSFDYASVEAPALALLQV